MKTIFLSKPSLLLLMFFLTFFFFSCGNPEPAICPKALCSITGQVVDSIGGSSVGGATVVIDNSSYASVTTDANGYFRIADVREGVYDITVTKQGRAGSRLRQVSVEPNNPEVLIVLPEYSYLPASVNPPTINVENVFRDEEYQGIVPIDINVRAGSCPVVSTGFHQSVYLRIGVTGLNLVDVAESSTDRLSYEWNTSLLAAGKAVVQVVSYDTNNNRCEIDIPVKVISGSGSAPSLAPVEENYSITAETYGQSLDIMRSFPGITESQKQSGSFPRSIIPDTTVLVEFAAAKFYNGIMIYRAAAINGNYDLIGQATFTAQNNFSFIDYSPTLEPGSTVYYKLSYFNQYGSGPKTDAIPVRILPKYSLSLVSPANNANVIDTTPTISWVCNPALDAQRTDWIIASNVLDATVVAYSFVINRSEFTLPDLLYNNQYEWDVRSVYEYVNSKKTANVMSRSFPRGRDSDDFSINGSFYFTVVQQ
jgi:hypothetical protein